MFHYRHYWKYHQVAEDTNKAFRHLTASQHRSKIKIIETIDNKQQQKKTNDLQECLIFFVWQFH